MKIYTCALKPFEADDYFYTRDSGLLCRSFQNIGVESKVIMPRRKDDLKDPYHDVVRGTMEELRSPCWWGNLGIDAVAIVTWGHVEDTPVIRAAKESGIKIILVTDDGEGGITGFSDLLKMTWGKLYHLTFPRRQIETLTKIPLLYLWSRWRKRGRYSQYQYADLITCWTTRIASNVRQGLRCRDYNQPKFIHGYPSSTDTNLDFTTKERPQPPSIIAVARWDAIKHKRPHFLMDVCKTLLEKDARITIHIYGRTIPYMYGILEMLPKSQKERLFLHGFCDNSEILSRMRLCDVAICPSAAECGPVPMAEALCQGCSVVGGGNVAEWAAKSGYGTIVSKDNPVAFSEAVITEIEKWHRGNYDRRANASFWKEHYGSTRLAEQIRDSLIILTAKTTGAPPEKH